MLASLALGQSRKPTTRPVDVKARIDFATKSTTLSLFVAAGPRLEVARGESRNSRAALGRI